MLVVDDDPIIASGLDQILTRKGFDVVSFTESPKALEYLRNETSEFDVLIADRVMPEITGDVLVKECRSLRPSVPVVFCTGFVDDLPDDERRQIGADAYCLKPYDCDELGELIARLLIAKR